jgi:hypothetical protein
MAIETVLVLLSLLSFAALVVTWIAAPLHAGNHAESPQASTVAAEAAGTTVAA